MRRQIPLSIFALIFCISISTLIKFYNDKLRKAASENQVESYASHELIGEGLPSRFEVLLNAAKNIFIGEQLLIGNRRIELEKRMNNKIVSQEEYQDIKKRLLESEDQIIKTQISALEGEEKELKEASPPDM